jgi:hypothetical protein
MGGVTVSRPDGGLWQMATRPGTRARAVAGCRPARDSGWTSGQPCRSGWSPLALACVADAVLRRSSEGPLRWPVTLTGVTREVTQLDKDRRRRHRSTGDSGCQPLARVVALWLVRSTLFVLFASELVATSLAFCDSFSELVNELYARRRVTRPAAQMPGSLPA